MSAGNGGAGICSSITGARVFYAGGGGGGIAQSTGSYGLGVAGGGNGCDDSFAATSATSNSGSGGGGAAHNTFPIGGNGGSGIVIIRYPANCAPPASTTGLQQVLYNNGFQVYVWTSNGTITF